MPSYDVISAELLEKSLLQEALWKEDEAHECAAPLVFMKKPGSDDFKVGVPHYTDVEAFLDVTKRNFKDRGYNANDFRDIRMQQEGFAKRLNGGTLFDADFAKGMDFGQLYGDGSYAYLFLVYDLLGGNFTDNTLFICKDLTGYNKKHGISYKPLVMGVDQPSDAAGGMLCDISREIKEGVMWVPSGEEAAFRDFVHDMPGAAQTMPQMKAHDMPSGTLYLPDLKLFEGRAEIIEG